MIKEAGKQLRILDFDTESVTVGWTAWEVGSMVTAWAAAWITDNRGIWVSCPDPNDREALINTWENFLVLYNQADIVTGHNIRRHDLPRLNATLVELGLPSLGPKLTQDTLTLQRMTGIRKSQKSLAEMLGVVSPKVGVSDAEWRGYHMGDPAMLQIVQQRVMGDVVQHVQLRQKLLEQGLLAPPKMWTPFSKS